MNMKEWKNPELWELSAECTEGGHEGNNFDGIIVNVPCFGRVGLLES